MYNQTQRKIASVINSLKMYQPLSEYMQAVSGYGELILIMVGQVVHNRIPMIHDISQPSNLLKVKYTFECVNGPQPVAGSSNY